MDVEMSTSFSSNIILKDGDVTWVQTSLLSISWKQLNSNHSCNLSCSVAWFKGKIGWFVAFSRREVWRWKKKSRDIMTASKFEIIMSDLQIPWTMMMVLGIGLLLLRVVSLIWLMKNVAMGRKQAASCWLLLLISLIALAPFLSCSSLSLGDTRSE